MPRVDPKENFEQSEGYNQALFEHKSDILHQCLSCEEYFDNENDLDRDVCTHCRALEVTTDAKIEQMKASNS